MLECKKFPISLHKLLGAPLLPAHTKAEEYAIKDAVNKIEAGK